VKPLLEVTNNEEKLSQKEQELKAVNDKFEKMKQEREELEHQYQQLAEERSMLAQQFRAEAELCAETEEVRAVQLISCKCFISISLGLN
jgi:myosin protein heavy chain